MPETRHASSARRLRGAILCAGWLIAQSAAGWTLDDMLRVTRFSAAMPSPNGELVAYVECRANLDTRPSRYQGRLMVAGADGSSRRPLSGGNTNVSEPRWSPDGAWIAYLANDPGETANVALIPADGGTARRLSDFAEGVVDLRWSPRGDALAVLRPEPAGAAAPAADAVVAGASPAAHHLWLIRVQRDGRPGTPRRLTGGAFNVGHPLLDGAFDWSPDGRSIAFTRTDSPALDDWPSADIAIVDVNDGSLRSFQQSDAAEFAPHYAPNGSRIAFNITMYPPSWIRQSRIGLARPDGSRLKLLAATPDQQPGIVGWVSNRTLLVQEPSRTVTALWTLPINGNEPRRFDADDALLEAVTLNDPRTRLAFSVMRPTEAPEVAVTPLRQFRPALASASNAALPPLPQAEIRTVTWSAADGREIEGILVLPAPYRPGQRLPLVVMVHGGPALTHQARYLGYPDPLEPLAALAARGYASLRPNARGSSGYGHEFRAANRGDWGGADYQDVIAGIDRLVTDGIADPQRLAIAGWSYGGYLSTWAVTRGHRFAAAVAGAPVTDLLQIALTSDIHDFVPDYLHGDYWGRPELYRQRSPLLAADQVTTPVLLLHGAMDTRVPPGQSQAFYQALHRQGIDARLISYPRAGHLLDEPRQIRHAAGETLDWLERYLPVQ